MLLQTDMLESLARLPVERVHGMILEVGSFAGTNAVALLYMYPGMRIDCVDL